MLPHVPRSSRGERLYQEESAVAAAHTRRSVRRRMGQEDGHRRVLLGCRSPSFSITVCPAQGKFKNWARRITLVPDSTLMLGNRLVVPRDRYADIAWTFHVADPQRHLTISEVVLRIQTVYTWGRQNFGMCWEVAAYVCGTCDRPACRSRSAHLGAAAYLNFGELCLLL
ncbi:uncharacterized protein ISCGN_018442 [Ixodes scapularis]